MTYRSFFLALSLAASMSEATQVMHRPEIYERNSTRHIEFGRPLIQKRELEPRATGKVSMAYFVNWGIYARNFQVTDIVPSTLTHILYAFADCDASSGNVILTDTFADQQKHFATDSWSETGNNLYGNLKQLYLLKQKNRNLKVSLSVGGWTYSQSGHFGFVTNPTARAQFISSAITLLEDNGFDGIDIDFEYPSTAAQGSGFASLLSELRTALNNHASKKGDTVPYIITAAVGAGPSGYSNLAIPQMDSSLTFWNLMAYDYAGSWSTVTDHQANVYGGAITGFSTDTAVNYYLSKGATASKVLMGMPLYGRGWTGTAGFQKPFSGLSQGSFETGIWDYKVLPLSGSAVTEDNVNIASYSYGNSELVSYDTPNIIRKKVAYANSKGFAGSMFWELSNDRHDSNSLVGVSASALGSLDNSQNHLNYPGSQFVNVRNQMGGGGGTPTTSTQPTQTSGSGSCSGVAAWSSSAVYTVGMKATYGGHLWTAKWWTQNEIPATKDGGPWTDNGAC
jgi:chitinase